MNKNTKKNLKRKSTYIDDIFMHNNIPLFSWIDINPTELCNRKCIFCPRVDESDYPNQKLFMSLELGRKISSELKEIDYKGAVVLSGYGEPTLHTDFESLISCFKGVCRVELVTNGDTLNKQNIIAYSDAGVDFFVISLYDGPEQVEHFESLFKQLNFDKNRFILRDRWHTSEDGFGLKLTNRAGKVIVGDQPEVSLNKPCFYTAYSLTIDWNGDVLLCMQDWHKKVKFGNANYDSLVKIWNSHNYKLYRKQLLNGSRGLAPCNKCNTDGTLHGEKHAEAWKKII